MVCRFHLLSRSGKYFGFKNDNAGLLMMSLTLIHYVQKYHSPYTVDFHKQMSGDTYAEKLNDIVVQ